MTEAAVIGEGFYHIAEWDKQIQIRQQTADTPPQQGPVSNTSAQDCLAHGGTEGYLSD